MGNAVNPSRSRLGLRALKRVVSLRGLSLIDRRTLPGRVLAQWIADVTEMLGGADSLSPLKRDLIQKAAVTKMIIDHIDHDLVGRETLINRRKKSVLPIVLERQRLLDSYAKLAVQLGLDKVPKPIPTIDDIEREFEKEKTDEHHRSDG